MSNEDLLNCYTFVPKHEIILQTEEKNGQVVRVEKVNILNQEKRIVYGEV